MDTQDTQNTNDLQVSDTAITQLATDVKKLKAGRVYQQDVVSGAIKPRHLVSSTTQARGDTFYSDGTNFVRSAIGATGSIQTASGNPTWLAPGTTNQVLTMSGGVPTWAASQSVSTDGWITEASTFTYASATSVTTSGSITAYTKGTRVKFTNNSTTFYGTVASSTGSTITFITNSNFSIANSAITNPSYSYVVNPQGYPSTFSYTVNCSSGFTTTIAATYKFSVVGHIVFIHDLQMGNGGTSNTTSIVIPLPVNNLLGVFNIGVAFGRDNGSNLSSPLEVETVSSVSAITIWVSFFQTAFTNSGNKSIYTLVGSYEF